MFAKTAALLLWAAAGLAFAQAEHAHHSSSQGGRPAASAWSAQPLLLPSAERGERGRTRLQPLNLAAGSVEVFGPAAPEESRSFPVADGAAVVVPADPKVGNYHWVIARESRPGEERLASTAWFVSNPGPAPTRLLAAVRPGLAIVPRLPREHGSYREGEQWDFSVRFDGQPLAGATLTLETEFGTRSRAIADDNGVARLVFPRDFDPARAADSGHGRRAAAGFAVSAEIERGGVRHVSAFNGTYAPDPWRSRNLMAGVGFLLLGMAAATPLLRRKEEKK